MHRKITVIWSRIQHAANASGFHDNHAFHDRLPKPSSSKVSTATECQRPYHAPKAAIADVLSTNFSSLPMRRVPSSHPGSQLELFAELTVQTEAEHSQQLGNSSNSEIPSQREGRTAEVFLSPPAKDTGKCKKRNPPGGYPCPFPACPKPVARSRRRYGSFFGLR